jgi:hypothetical protein
MLGDRLEPEEVMRMHGESVVNGWAENETKRLSVDLTLMTAG